MTFSKFRRGHVSDLVATWGNLARELTDQQIFQLQLLANEYLANKLFGPVAIQTTEFELVD